jgi:hypothetical protein
VRAGTRVSITFDWIDRYGCASFDLQTQESHRSHVPTTDVCLAHVLSNTYAQFQSPEEWQYVLRTQVCFARNGYRHGMPVGMCCNEMGCGID